MAQAVWRYNIYRKILMANSVCRDNYTVIIHTNQLVMCFLGIIVLLFDILL